MIHQTDIAVLVYLLYKTRKASFLNEVHQKHRLYNVQHTARTRHSILDAEMS
jgi:hypothetical protein